MTTTPEKIKAAVTDERYPVYSGQPWDALERILTRILCPEPEKPDHSRDATEKGGDRAAEMAEEHIMARHWLADALRAYGDELLDKAAAKVDEQAEGGSAAADTILSFKSDATKGAM